LYFNTKKNVIPGRDWTLYKNKPQEGKGSRGWSCLERLESPGEGYSHQQFILFFELYRYYAQKKYFSNCSFKGTVKRDFLASVFFMDLLY
jgi:hypothetical protein